MTNHLGQRGRGGQNGGHSERWKSRAAAFTHRGRFWKDAKDRSAPVKAMKGAKSTFANFAVIQLFGIAIFILSCM